MAYWYSDRARTIDIRPGFLAPTVSPELTQRDRPRHAVCIPEIRPLYVSVASFSSRKWPNEIIISAACEVIV